MKVPKLCKGTFLPSVIEPRRRIDRALSAVVKSDAYVAGMSTRSPDDLVAAVGAESGVSKSEVSRICAWLDDTVEAFRSRRLDHIEFPYVCEVEAVEFLQGLPAGFEPGVGAQEGVEAGLVGVVELVASAHQQEPGSEHFGVQGGLDAGGLSALDVSAHRGEPRREPSDHVEAVQHMAR